MNIRILLLTAAALALGACGGNDQDIEQEVEETAATPEYVMPEDEAGVEPVLEQETQPSRDPYEEVIPTPETEMDLDPAQGETAPDTATPATPEDGMPGAESPPQ